MSPPLNFVAELSIAVIGVLFLGSPMLMLITGLPAPLISWLLH